MTYEAGFAQGEIDAFSDRAMGNKPSVPPPGPKSVYQQGYWDAYTPRSATWRINTKHQQLEAA